MARRFFDVSVAVCGLVVTSPLLLLAAVMIKISSRGPILYHARRVGRDRRLAGANALNVAAVPERRRQGYHGREFTLYKFRTMRVTPAAGRTDHGPERFPRVPVWSGGCGRRKSMSCRSC